MSLIDAVVENNVEEVRRLLEEGADPNMYLDAAKVRPLHFAAQNNNIEIVKLLLTAGADVYAVTEPDEQTVFEIAQLHAADEVISLLSAYIR